MSTQRERKSINLAQFKSLEGADGGFEGIANHTGVLDSYDDITLAGCFAQLSDFVRQGWAAPDHEWGVKDEIGVIEDARETDEGLFVRVEFHPTADAQAVREKAKNRLAKGKSVRLSIGYEVLEGGARYVTGHEALEYVKNPTPEIIARLQKTHRVRLLTKIKVYEVSIVSVGAEPTASVTAVKSAGEKGAFAAAAAGAEHKGLFVGCFLSAEAARALAVEGGTPAEDLHVTLAYCGDVTATDDLTVAEAMVAVKHLAEWREPLSGKVSGTGRFSASNTSNGKDVVCALVDMPGLADLHVWLDIALTGAGMPPRREHGFLPHVTLAYVGPDAPAPVERVEQVALRFDALTISVGGERTVVPLAGGRYGYFGGDDAESKDSQVGESQGLLAGLSFADHSERALAAVEGFTARAKAIAALRTKEGRTLSAANRARIEETRARLTEARSAIDAVDGDLGGLLEMSEPKPKAADPARVLRLRAEFLKTDMA
jgi:2'-5' RNA ligase